MPAGGSPSEAAGTASRLGGQRSSSCRLLAKPSSHAPSQAVPRMPACLPIQQCGHCLPAGLPACQHKPPSAWPQITHHPQGTPNDGLQPAELNYATIALAFDGVAWAELAAVEGSGAATWPRLLSVQSQCGCCKLCFAQNAAALADTTVSRAGAGEGAR